MTTAKNWTVCLIEPNKFEGQIIVDLLRNAGVDKVKLVASQEDALDLLEVYNANVIILSYETEPLNGAAWTKVFRRNRKLANRKAAVFVTSAAFSRTVAEDCRHAGANALIGKPISGKVLINTIVKVLGAPRPFIDAEGYVGPCRRAGIVTAGAPKKRRKADESATAAEPALQLTLGAAVEALMAATAKVTLDAGHAPACEAALRSVQGYAVNAGDGPLMRACAAFALQLASARSMRMDVFRVAIESCVNGVSKLATMDPTKTEERERIAEAVRQAVAKAAMQRAA